MPIYEYECEKCGTKIEIFQLISESDKEAKCPKCNIKSLRRVISPFSSRCSSGGSCGPSAPT